MIVVTVNQQGVPPAVASGSSEPCLPPTPAADRPAPRHRSRSGPVRRHRRRRCEAGCSRPPPGESPGRHWPAPGPDLPCTHDRQPRYDRPGAQAPLVLLVVPDGEDRIGFVLLDVAELCRSPDVAWSALRRAWTRLAEQRRERAGHGHGHGRAGPVRDGQAVTAGLTDRVLEVMQQMRQAEEAGDWLLPGQVQARWPDVTVQGLRRCRDPRLPADGSREGRGCRCIPAPPGC